MKCVYLFTLLELNLHNIFQFYSVEILSQKEEEITELRKLVEKLQMNLKEKSAEVKRLKNLLAYYVQRSKSLKEINECLKSEKLISSDAERELNVSYVSVL